MRPCGIGEALCGLKFIIEAEEIGEIGDVFMGFAWFVQYIDGIDDDGAFDWFVQAGDGAHEGGFSGAVWPDKGDGGALLNREVYIGEGGFPGIFEGQIVDFYDIHGCTLLCFFGLKIITVVLVCHAINCGDIVCVGKLSGRLRCGAGVMSCLCCCCEAFAQQCLLSL